ncbi:MAG: hypothetical protein ACI90V_013498, partial [Bacillariaceae sp.]
IIAKSPKIEQFILQLRAITSYEFFLIVQKNSFQ